MKEADEGTKDILFSWKSFRATPNILDWIFFSSPYQGILNFNRPKGVFTLAYTGGNSYADSVAETFRFQRPAL